MRRLEKRAVHHLYAWEEGKRQIAITKRIRKNLIFLLIFYKCFPIMKNEDCLRKEGKMSS